MTWWVHGSRSQSASLRCPPGQCLQADTASEAAAVFWQKRLLKPSSFTVRLWGRPATVSTPDLVASGLSAGLEQTQWGEGLACATPHRMPQHRIDP